MKDLPSKEILDSADDSPSCPARRDVPGSLRERLRRYTVFLIPCAIVAVTGMVFYLTELVKNPTEQQRVLQGGDYYVFVSLVELTEQNGAGEAWDLYNDSAPDIFVEMFWRGQRVFQSTTKEDTLIAKFSNTEVDLLNLALKGGRASLDETVHAARITVAEGETLEIRVYDSDLLGRAEPAGVRSFQTVDLLVGDTTYVFDEPGVRRIILRVLDMKGTPDLLSFLFV